MCRRKLVTVHHIHLDVILEMAFAVALLLIVALDAILQSIVSFACPRKNTMKQKMADFGATVILKLQEISQLLNDVWSDR